ncbi:putative serine protease PepD [Herbihabitans rhizosphaerae]|uniref:Putative serine protease PepD n=1 Tax=Herbihabitans rhizosphaerae TaxID=1872711 RepID=A0A4Q7L5R9_9PSEU|nr:trypsin-like peptidase domain-containing protein [Herbihabitans rhizosphaerae]RZS44677.1 putative serine protease PepD [Herbihabitans rhizosphaerae]
MTENKPEQQHGEPTPPSPWSAAGAQQGHAQQGEVPQHAPQAPQQEQVLFGSAFGAGSSSGPGYGPGQTHGAQTHGAQTHSAQSAAPPATQTLPPHSSGQTEPGRRGASGLVTGMTVLALLVGGGAGAVGGYLAADSDKPAAASSTSLDTTAPAPPASQTAASPPGTIEAVAEKVLPSVVQIQVRSGQSSGSGGSGFVISQDGLIVTNNHVVEGGADGGQIAVQFQDGKTAQATIVGRDPESDVAVIKAQGVSGLKAAELGRSDSLKVGQAVVAVGSPFGLAGTVTSGIVSSLHRPTRAGGSNGDQATVMDAIQTDASINHGNSGGPLVDMQGRVVGINSAIYSPRESSGSGQQGGSVGIGFSIPIDQARRTADGIVKTGKATQTFLGAKVTDSPQGGAQIAEVTPGGPGEKAGLKAGDVVTQFNERKIDTSDALVAAVRARTPGEKVKLVLASGSATVDVTLEGKTVEVK